MTSSIEKLQEENTRLRAAGALATTTQELVERLNARLERVQHTGARGYHLPGDAKLDQAAASRLSEMEAENKRLREALTWIAKQVPAKDMDEDYYEAADFEDSYDRCVFEARAALEHHHNKEEKL